MRSYRFKAVNSVVTTPEICKKWSAIKNPPIANAAGKGEITGFIHATCLIFSQQCKNTP